MTASAVAAEPTVLATWTATVARTLTAKGHDGHSIVRRAGIDAEVFDLDGGRIPLSQSTRLWELAVEASGDPCFGLDVARSVRPSTFAALSIGVVTSPSFRDALERVSRFQAVAMAPAGEIRLSESDRRLSWTNSFAACAMPPCYEAMEAILASITLTGRFLLGRSFSPTAVHLERPEQPSPDRFDSFFKCPVRYGADAYGLEFSSDSVARPLPGGSSTVMLAADRLATSYVGGLATSSCFADEVRAVIAELCESGAPGTADVAAALAVSPRTLQRRLRAEETTVRRLIDEVQAELACDMLAVAQLSVSVVAERLGFHDASSFRRAFKRWTGVTPAEYAAR